MAMVDFHLIELKVKIREKKEKNKLENFSKMMRKNDFNAHVTQKLE